MELRFLSVYTGYYKIWRSLLGVKSDFVYETTLISLSTTMLSNKCPMLPYLHTKEASA